MRAPEQRGALRHEFCTRTRLRCVSFYLIERRSVGKLTRDEIGEIDVVVDLVRRIQVTTNGGQPSSFPVSTSLRHKNTRNTWWSASEAHSRYKSALIRPFR